MAASRSIFRFKQFQLAHGNPGLKISTEACLFGAWAGHWAKGRILDIGTGSGLLACMLAQKHPQFRIDAIEILQEVAALATENVQASPYQNQISVYTHSLQTYLPTEKYDFIVCNPPFFHQHLAAEKQDLQAAIHDDLLIPQDLAAGIHSHGKI
jgi:tRNA1Val (adenine37-N6)-methyltransferase